jgi:predicted kinase
VWFEDDSYTPLIIDCLEFSRELRETGAARDVGFLSMDLTYRGRQDFAERLLNRYANETDDFGLFWVVDFCQGYRAMVRAKVAAIASADPALEEAQRQAAEESVRGHLELAERLLRRRPTGCLILLCGKVGTGKSTVAELLADECGGILVSSDRLRKKLAGLPPEARVEAPTDTGLYSPERKAAVYEAMLGRAEPVVTSGRPALLDASFDTAARRDRARRWAGEHDAPILLVGVDCTEEIVLERLAKRQEEGSSASDAGPDFYATSAARFEPPDEWPRETHLQLRTDSANWRDEARRKFRKSYDRNLEAPATSER